MNIFTFVFLIFIFSMTGCGKQTDKAEESNIQPTPQPIAAETTLAIDPKTSNCGDIFHATKKVNKYGFSNFYSSSYHDVKPTKDEFEKTQDYKIRLTTWIESKQKKIFDEVSNLGKDGIVVFGVGANQEYNADKELLTVKSGKIKKLNSSGHQLIFSERETSTDSEPMKGYHITSMRTDAFRVTFDNADSIIKHLSNGYIFYSQNLPPNDAKNATISISIAGYPIEPYYNSKSKTFNYTSNLYQTDSEIDFYLHLRCIFIYEDDTNKLLKTIET